MTIMRRANDLAIFSGKPSFKEKLHVGRPNLGDRETLLTKLDDILDSRWLTNNGPYVQSFERNLAELLKVKHCIVMCNATVALEIAIRALGLRSEVIVPSFTFIATPHSLKWQEITPVFCDIDPNTHNIDPVHIEKLITSRTTGIVGVHLWGRPCPVEAMEEIAQKYDLKLMFDAAHAFACSYKNRMIGGFGDAEVFSFHATKFFNTFEGGAVTTNNDKLAEKIRLMKNFGFAGYDKVIYIGTNGKMNELSAAMGLTGLESLDEFIRVNHQNYNHYQEHLKGIPGISLVKYNEVEKNNFQYVVLEVDKDNSDISRDILLKILHAENILARRYFYPGCHNMEPYRTEYPGTGLNLPHTERLVQRVLSLPTGTTVGQAEIQKICQIIRLAVSHGKAITKKLGQLRLY